MRPDHPLLRPRSILAGLLLVTSCTIATASVSVAQVSQSGHPQPGWSRSESLDWMREKLLVATQPRAVGEPHLLITFDPRLCGVELSPNVRSKHPAEITIILQHDFERLVVAQDWFTVVLRFSGRQERVRVPYSAVSAFYDVEAGQSTKVEPTGKRPDADGRCES